MSVSKLTYLKPIKHFRTIQLCPALFLAFFYVVSTATILRSNCRLVWLSARSLQHKQSFICMAINLL